MVRVQHCNCGSGCFSDLWFGYKVSCSTFQKAEGWRESLGCALVCVSFDPLGAAGPVNVLLSSELKMYFMEMFGGFLLLFPFDKKWSCVNTPAFRGLKNQII